MKLDNMIVGSDLASQKDKIKKIFFYRICGTGMGACACLAKEAGFEVAGADMTFSPPMSTYLETLDIELKDLKSLSHKDLIDFDLIVVGNSVPRNSEFARFVEDSGIPFTSFPSFLGEFILKEKEVIGLAGTHGKTTTTYFLTQMLESLGEDTGYFVGGIIDGRAPSRLGKSKYFVIESDEYDSAYFQKISKFRLYELDHMILTSLEFDHADIFNSIEDIKEEFSSVIPSLPGKLVVNDAYKAIKELSEKHNNKEWSFYGEKSENGPHNINVFDGKTSFEIRLGNNLTKFQTNIIGTHNILNISSCILSLYLLGFDAVKLQQSVLKLEMVKRRQELRGHFNGALIIDDFAHHPKAISLTLEGLKLQYPNKKLITVFEPISATARSSIFQEEFKTSLMSSSEVIIAVNTLTTTVKDSKNLDTAKLVKDLNDSGIPAQEVTEVDNLISALESSCDESTLVAVLSNRTCIGLWESRFVKNLS
jgi:UDP-N-acetylmuramate: L-alanyl-gamma-D-glutamyl-meso-diaminopimelate ligase